MSAERFSLISQSILNRFTCNFAHTIRSHCGDCPENLVRFDRVFQKLLMWLKTGLHWNSTEEVPSLHRTCVTEQLELTRQVRIERDYQHYIDIGPISFFFFFFFFKIWYLAENKREKIAFPKYFIEGDVTLLHFLMTPFRSHCGHDCPENFVPSVRFDRVLSQQKLLMWCTETTLFPHRQSAENAGRHWNSTEEVPSLHRTCVTEQLELTRQVARIERVIINTTST